MGIFSLKNDEIRGKLYKINGAVGKNKECDNFSYKDSVKVFFLLQRNKCSVNYLVEEEYLELNI